LRAWEHVVRYAERIHHSEAARLFMRRSMGTWAHVGPVPGPAADRASSQTFLRMSSIGFLNSLGSERRVGLSSAFADPSLGPYRANPPSRRGSGALPLQRRGSMEVPGAPPWEGDPARNPEGSPGALFSARMARATSSPSPL
jgi:hypothetical protein